jgi:multidrug efflux pump subunit AcrA (membrane-fusion protein)
MQKRHILIAAIFSLLTVVGCTSQATYGNAITEGEPTPLPTPVVPSKPVYQVESGDIIYQQRYSGRVVPAVSQTLTFELDGRVAETFVSDGDTVQQGDVLAVLDTTDLEAQLLNAQEELAVVQSIFDSASNQVDFGKARAQLELDLAQIRLDFALSQASEPYTDHDNFVISTRIIERDLAQLAVDEVSEGVDPELRFDVERAQDVVDSIQADIDRSQLIAPMDGILTSFPIEAGDVMIAYDFAGVVADTSTVQVLASLTITQLEELSEGMTVMMQQTNLPDDVFYGTITQLPEPYGTGTSEDAYIAFDTQPTADSLRLGDRVTLTVTIEERQGVLWLPPSAIRQFSGRNFVVIQNDSVQQRVDVRLGLEGNDRVEILEGLEEAQTVIGP